MPKQKEHKVSVRKLGRERAVGLAYHGSNKIEIDERLSGKRYLHTLLHEFLHLQYPDWSETKVDNDSRAMAKFLWQQQFRFVELK